MPKAKNVKSLRVAAGLTQEQLADAIGVSKRTVLAWEHRDRSIPMPASKRIAEFFGIDYHEFCNHDVTSDMILTDEEIHLIEQYREISETSKAIIRAAINAACLMEKDNS